MSQMYRWIAPDGPARTPAELAAWAIAELLGKPGEIFANKRDLPALRATMLVDRVALPPQGVVQAGTLWIAAAVQP